MIRWTREGSGRDSGRDDLRLDGRSCPVQILDKMRGQRWVANRARHGPDLSLCVARATTSTFGDAHVSGMEVDQMTLGRSVRLDNGGLRQ